MEPVILLSLLLACPFLAADEATPCIEGLSEEIVNGIIRQDGSLLASDGIVYPPEDYWNSTSADGTKVYRGCVCNQKVCVRKCCPFGYIYEHGKKPGECTPNQNVTDVNDSYSSFHVLIGVTCAAKYMMDPSEYFRVNDDGTLFNGAENSTSTADLYCLEAFVTNESVVYVVPFPCFPDEEEEMPVEDESPIFLLYPIGLLISEPFLVATFLVYALIPELRNLHGKVLMSHTTTLFTAYLFLAIVQIGGRYIGMEFCIATAFIIYYAFLASFFWLNVMCFDMWWTFSGFHRMRGSGKRLERKKFIIYSAYAWGAPFVLFVVCLGMQFSGLPAPYITPQFGLGKCWFGDERALLPYFYGPIGVLVTANIAMFITTALKILKLKKETAMLKGSESRRHDEDGNNKERFSLYLKLFVVMGVNWGMEVLSWATGGPEYLWYITDLGNALQGVLIFFIFVWKDKIKRLLVRRFSRSAVVNSRSKANSTRTSTTRVSMKTASLNSTCFTDTTNTYPLVQTDSVGA